MKYLFNDWARIKKKTVRRSLFIFLDFDGTLAPIARTPKKAFLPDATRDLLKKVSRCPAIKLAVISGRQLKDVKGKVGIKGLIYSGNHGLEMEGPGVTFYPAIPRAYLAAVRQIRYELKRRTGRIKGAFLENKGLTLSLHYRGVSREYVDFLKSVFWDVVLYYVAGHTVQAKQGKMVLEIRPPVEWDKGSIVSWLLAKYRFARKGIKTLPVYIGDDVTDEDAFKAISKNGLAVFVGRPKKSFAQYYLRNHKGVRSFLQRILEQYND